MIIFICSRLRGNFKENLEFAEAMAGAIARNGNIPLCPHQIAHYLDDDVDEERRIGMNTAKQMLMLADEIHVFVDETGISEGMASEIMSAIHYRKTIRFFNRGEIWNTINTRSNLASEALKSLESIKSSIMQ